MTLKRIGLTGSVNRQVRITGRRITLNRVSLRRFPFPSTSVVSGPNIEEIFSTFIYSGSGVGTQQTITNGIDLDNKGGLVWGKIRFLGDDHYLFDTLRGGSQGLRTDTAGASGASGIAAFTSTGFIVKDSLNNNSTQSFASWTFRKQAKFFDVVTYTGNGTGQNISHALGSIPGFILIKRTDASADWRSYHRGIGNPGEGGAINGTAQWSNLAAALDGSVPTATTFSPASGANTNGASYVAYLFAHDSGGFGATGSDNVISCGAYVTTTGGTQDITLGYEPQWVLMTRAYGAGAVSGWFLFDTMRLMAYSDNAYLEPNSTAPESLIGGSWIRPTPTGFTVASALNGGGTAGYTFVYIAIRRGPMKTPTSGANVYNAIARTGTGTSTAVTGVGFPPDALLQLARNGFHSNLLVNRLGSANNYLATDSTSQEAPASDAFFTMDGYTAKSYLNYNTSPDINYFFRRSPGFFDVVFYTGTGANRTVSHNLTVAPELMFVKRRSSVGEGAVYTAARGGTEYMELFSTNASNPSSATPVVWNDTAPNSSVFTVGTNALTNGSGTTYVAYLFATVAGVSKVGNYTGNGSNQTINCGFTAGARFIMIKRTDSIGDWYVWDTARGIVSGNDPYLLLNTVASEVTTNDSIDPDNTGFIVNQLSATNINVNNATYIFLAIA